MIDKQQFKSGDRVMISEESPSCGTRGIHGTVEEVSDKFYADNMLCVRVKLDRSPTNNLSWVFHPNELIFVEEV